MATRVLINPNELPQENYGLGLPRVKLEHEKAQPENYPAIPLLKDDEPSMESLLGTPIYEPLGFQHPDIDADNIYKLFEFEDDPLIQVRLHKNIVKTNVVRPQRTQGTVKELIGMGDYYITITGEFCNMEGVAYPLDKIAKLNKVVRINETLNIVSKTLNGLGIHTVVIEDVDFDRVAGMPNIAPYKITCISDEPVELKLKKP